MHLFVNLVVSGLIFGSQIGLVSLGFASIEAVQKTFHFAHGGVILVGGYLTWWLVSACGLGNALSIVIAVIACSLMGVAIKLGLYDRLRARGTREELVMVSALSAFLVIVNVIGFIAGSSPRFLSVPFSAQQVSLPFGAITVTPVELTMVAVLLAFVVVTWVLLRFGRLGRMLRCVIDDRSAAVALGLPVIMIEIAAFAFGSALAGLSGALSAFSPGVDLTTPFELLLFGITAAVAAGVRNVPLAGLVGLLLGIALDVPLLVIPDGFQTALGLLFLVALLWLRPREFTMSERDSRVA
jgi:branched-chain amino acid transport system permease protein